MKEPGQVGHRIAEMRGFPVEYPDKCAVTRIDHQVADPEIVVHQSHPARNLIGSIIQPGQRQIQDRDPDARNLVVRLAPLVVLDASGIAERRAAGPARSDPARPDWPHAGWPSPGPPAVPARPDRRDR